MCGGAEDDFARVEPVIAVYARACRLMGPSGAGQLTKMVNQIAIAGLIQSLSEALHFAVEAGLDAGAVIDLLKNGAAQSWQMENRTATMLAGEFDHGFAVEWMRKDLAICLEESPPQRRATAGRGAGRPVLRRRREARRPALGHVEPDHAAEALISAKPFFAKPIRINFL